jgi:hypothetical protein
MGHIIHYIRTVTEITVMVYLAVQHNLLLSSGMHGYVQCVGLVMHTGYLIEFHS